MLPVDFIMLPVDFKSTTQNNQTSLSVPKPKCSTLNRNFQSYNTQTQQTNLDKTYNKQKYVKHTNTNNAMAHEDAQKHIVSLTFTWHVKMPKNQILLVSRYRIV